MIFTRLARLVAVTAFVFGLLRVLIGFSIATELMGPYEASLARYTTALSSGQVIDQGIATILLAIGLGTLAEISLSLRRTDP
jgi:hypothetical protein